MRQLTNEHQRRVTTQVRRQVWQPHASMDYVQCGGTPYWKNYNLGWQHCPNTPWNTSYTIPQTPQVQRSSLEEKIVELERFHAELVMENAEFRRSRAEMDCSQVGLPMFYDQKEMSQPPNGRMTQLEATMDELERVHAGATSQVQFMGLTRANVKI